MAYYLLSSKMKKKNFLIVILILTFLITSFVLVTGQEEDVKIESPIRYKTFAGLINAIIDFIFNLALVLVPLIIIISGYMFITAMGDPKRVDQARDTIIWAVVGILIILVAKGTIEVIKRVFGIPK